MEHTIDGVERLVKQLRKRTIDGVSTKVRHLREPHNRWRH